MPSSQCPNCGNMNLVREPDAYALPIAERGEVDLRTARLLSLSAATCRDCGLFLLFKGKFN